MDGIVVAFMVPAIVFLCFVAPVWIFMHYRSKQKSQSTLSEEERMQLETLSAHAERMMQRIDTLESILDNETPGWRDRMRSTATNDEHE
jgi:phage shock protein B